MTREWAIKRVILRLFKAKCAKDSNCHGNNYESALGTDYMNS
jgi:hypothetical protein